MLHKRAAWMISLTGWLVTAAAVAAVPALLFLERERPPYFWYRIAWTEFLTLVFWGCAGGSISYVLTVDRDHAGKGGVLPIKNMIIGIYVAFSFMLMISSDWTSRFHWGGQVILAVVAVLLFVALEYARAGQVAGAEPLPNGLRSPAEICALLRIHEHAVWSSSGSSTLAGADRVLHDSLKTLRESIQYSLQQVGRIGSCPEYEVFVADVERFCGELQVQRADSMDAKRL